MTFSQAMDHVVQVFETVGVVILAGGMLIAFVGAALALQRGRDPGTVYRALRSFVGRTILLSLEILVAADLIRTVAVEPSLESVAVLGLIVVIRTFLSFSLDIEIEGRLPWRASSRPGADGADPGSR